MVSTAAVMKVNDAHRLAFRTATGWLRSNRSFRTPEAATYYASELLDDPLLFTAPPGANQLTDADEHAQLCEHLDALDREDRYRLEIVIEPFAGAGTQSAGRRRRERAAEHYRVVFSGISGEDIGASVRVFPSPQRAEMYAAELLSNPLLAGRHHQEDPRLTAELDRLDWNGREALEVFIEPVGV
jgi:hypothetical protein